MTTKTNTYWELVRYYRDESGTLRSEPLGLYCSKERANMERAIYKDTDLHMVADEETVSLTVRKFKVKDSYEIVKVRGEKRDFSQEITKQERDFDNPKTITTQLP